MKTENIPLAAAKARAALVVLTLFAAVLTGCTKKELVELPPAAVTVIATVYDITTGEVLPDAVCTPGATVTLRPGADGSIAAQTVEISAAFPPDYISNTATVSVPAFPKGQGACIPLTIFLRPLISVVEDVTETPDPDIEPVTTLEKGEPFTLTNNGTEPKVMTFTYEAPTGQRVLNLDEIYARIDAMPDTRALNAEELKRALKALVGTYDNMVPKVIQTEVTVPAATIVVLKPKTNMTQYTMSITATVDGVEYTIPGVKLKEAGETTVENISDTPVEPGTQVYVAGRFETENRKATPCYWQNNRWTKLSDPDGAAHGECTAVTIAGSSVYLAGYGGNSACYWKDKACTLLSGDYGTVNSIAVAPDGSVYVGGESGYWTGSTGTPFGTSGFTGRALTVDGAGTVHIFGEIRQDGSGAPTACHWTGAVATPLGKTANSSATCATAPGSTVYAGGYYYDDQAQAQQPCYWADGVRTTLGVPGGTTLNSVLAICVAGATVYTAGYVDNGNLQHACYWENTACHTLDVPTGAYNATATGITVSGGKVYVCGTYQEQPTGAARACYWADGVRTDLTMPDDTKHAYATGIAVVEN